MKNIDKKWKTATCQVGAKCWCRLVVTENWSKKNDKLEDCIACSGELTKKHAQHFVKLHNEWLEKNGKYKRKNK
jgi:hypothetical protein